MKVNYAEKLLGGSTPDIKSKPSKEDEKYDYADSLLSGFVGDIPVNSVMTKDYIGKQDNPAGMGTNYKAGLVDDPETKIKIYAKTRFPDDPNAEKRYGFHNGEVVYRGDDDKLYRETPDTWWEKTKRFAAETGANLPALILGTIGATAGPGMAALGAAGGEGIRKSIGATALNEPQTAKGNLKDMAVEGALAATGEKVGGGLGRLMNYTGAKRGGKLATQAGRNRNLIDVAKTAEMEKLGKQVGIDLYPPQTTGSKHLADKFNLLGDLESSSDIIQKARTKQVEQIESSIYDQIKKISPQTGTASGRSDKLVEASKKAVLKPVRIRQSKASPLYKKAFSDNKQVDVESVVALIDDKLKTAKGGVRQHLLKAKKSLMNPDLPKKTTLLDANGNPLVEKLKYDTSLKGLHDSKVELDRLIKQSSKDSQGNIVKRNYQDIKSKLLEQMDAVSPDYKKARSVFSDLSDEVEKQGKKTILGDIAKLDGDKKINAVKKLLSSQEVRKSPEIITKLKKSITEQDPEAWNDAIADHLQGLFESIKSSATGGITNVGGNFYKKAYGDIAQRKVLKAAMSDTQYKTFENFMKVLKRTGIILSKESATASRQSMIEEMSGKTAGRAIRAITRPLYTKERLLGDKLLESMQSKHGKKLAEALVSEKASKQLQKMVQLTEGGKELTKQFTTFLTLVASGEYGRDNQRENTPDKIPGKN